MDAGTRPTTGARRDAEEFVRAVRGDGAAFAAFLARFERRLVRIVRALVPRGDAEDVFQEVCLRLLKNGDRYDPARPLTPWIDVVTRRVCADALRRRGRRLAKPLVVHPVAPAEPSFDPWVRDAVDAVLAEASAQQRDALRLVWTHGLTQREAARRLGVPPGTVASWVARAIRSLRTRLGEETT